MKPLIFILGLCACSSTLVAIIDDRFWRTTWGSLVLGIVLVIIFAAWAYVGAKWAKERTEAKYSGTFNAGYNEGRRVK